MPSFRYTALTMQGREASGLIEAPDIAAARADLRARALMPLELELGAVGAAGGGLWRRPLRRLPVRQRDKLFFFRQLALMVRSGHRILEALAISARLVEREGLARAIRRMAGAIEGGASFSGALAEEKRLFPDSIAALIAAGEQAGALDVALERAATALERSHTLRRRLTTAMAYPAVVLVTACLVVYGLMAFFVPRLTSFLEANRSDVHWTMQGLIDFTDWMEAYGLWLLGGTGAIAFGIAALSTQAWGLMLIHRALLFAPLTGLTIRLAETARLGELGAMLLSSGLSQVETLRVLARATGNVAMRKLYLDASDRLLSGERLSRGLEDRAVPELARHMIAVGEESGVLDDTLEKTGLFYREALENRIATLISFLIPAVTITLGGLVLVIYISMFSTILNAVNSVR